MKKLHYIGVFLWVLLTSYLCPAQNKGITGQDSSVVRHFRIYYPINKVELHPTYMSNEKNLEIIRTYLQESPRIDSIVIYSYASPEGPYRFNSKLAKQRGETAKRYILSQVPEGRHFPDSLIHLRPEAENWEGLYEEIVANYWQEDRDEVLTILESNMSDADKKIRLQRLNGRKAWKYILKHIMPKLRYATWISVWQPILKETEMQGIPSTAVAEDLSGSMNPVPVRRKESRTILALKTNLLYDLLTWFNFSVEVPIYKDRFSVLYQHQFPWWTGGESDNEYCNRFLSIGGEARWWFKPMPRSATTKRMVRDKLMGHYLGVYANSGKYDFEWKRDICYQGEFWSAGLSYGYAMPIGKRLNLEFSIAAGYAAIDYRHFTPTPGYDQLIRDPKKQGTWHYIGPTRAEVSLVIPLTITRTKEWKGGAQ